MITRRRRKAINTTKYKPGDIVVVRSDLNTTTKYKMEQSSRWNVATNAMTKLRGCCVTIQKIPYTQYEISELPGCCWTDEMFEGKAEDILSDIPSFYDYIGGGENA